MDEVKADYLASVIAGEMDDEKHDAAQAELTRLNARIAELEAEHETDYWYKKAMEYLKIIQTARWYIKLSRGNFEKAYSLLNGKEDKS